MATKKAKKATTTLKKTVKTVMNAPVKINDFALKSTENVLSEVFIAAGKWQVVTTKALKGSLKFTATKQDMIFDTLETAKSQVLKGFEKSKTLFSKN